MKNPKVSVVIPCYNHAQFVVEAMESVLNQTFEDLECIIIDDGSTDDSKETILDYIKRDKRFKYFFQENSGLSNARNKGISLSSGIYILPLDSDDKISANYIEKCFNTLESSLEIKIAYGQGFCFGVRVKKWELNNYSFEDLLYKNMIHCTGLYRREDWNKVGGYDANLKEGLEDWEFWIHILKFGGTAIKLKDCKFFYRIKKNSMVKDLVINNNYGYDSRLYIFNKHYYKYIKTNVYDMYFENYNLKKKLENPLAFISFNEFFLMFLKALIFKIRFFIKRITRKLSIG